MEVKKYFIPLTKKECKRTGAYYSNKTNNGVIGVNFSTNIVKTILVGVAECDGHICSFAPEEEFSLKQRKEMYKIIKKRKLVHSFVSSL